MDRLTFEQINNTGMKGYIVRNKKRNEILGSIFYYTEWNCLVWEQDKSIIMSRGCLLEVVEFMNDMKK